MHNVCTQWRREGGLKGGHTLKIFIIAFVKKIMPLVNE
jgi:hypothetical protein